MKLQNNDKGFMKILQYFVYNFWESWAEITTTVNQKCFILFGFLYFLIIEKIEPTKQANYTKIT